MIVLPSVVRPVVGDTGSLCGLGAYYRALEDTLLTTSQLNGFDYAAMRELISNEIGEPEDEEIPDAEHLHKYFTSK